MSLGGRLSDGDSTGQDFVNLTGGSCHKTLESTLGKNVQLGHWQGAGV